MIEYLYIFLNVTANVTKGLVSKQAAKFLPNAKRNIVFGFEKELICLAASLVVMLKNASIHCLNVTLVELAIFAVGGAFTAVFQLLWMREVGQIMYMTVSAYGNASFIIPCILGLAFLGEKFTLKTAAAFLITAVGIVIMYSCDRAEKTESDKKKITFSGFAMLLLLTVSQGISQFTQKLYMAMCPNARSDVYSFYTYLAALVVFIVAMAFTDKKRGRESAELCKSVFSDTWKYLLIISAGMYIATYFQTLAAKTLDAVILYPVTTALNLGGSTVMANIVFGDKITVKSVVGTLLVFAAVVLIK